MRKEVYFEELESTGRRIEELKSCGRWDKFYDGYYTGMITGIEYMFINEYCSDDEAWEEFKALREKLNKKIYEEV